MHSALRRPPTVTPLLVAVLGLLSMSSSIAMDTYLPALPDVASDLGTTPMLVQVTLTAFFVGQALGQLILGPMSDRYGRWRPLLVGSVIFVAAGVGAALAPNIWLLIALRTAQGFGAAAGPVIGRAVVADLATGARAARLFGILMMLFGIAPVIAPIIGGPLAEWGGWRATMWGIVVISVIALISVLIVPESLPAENRRVIPGRAIAGDFLDLLRIRPYLISTLLLAASFGVITAWLAASSFVLQEYFGLSPTGYSLSFAVIFLGFLLAGFANTLLLRRFLPVHILHGSMLVLVASVALLVLFLAIDALPLWLLLLLATVSCGMVAPISANATAIGIGAVPSNRAGSASALMGALETLIPASVIPVLGMFGSTPAPLVIAFAICAMVCLGLDFALRAAPGVRLRGSAA
ncbi:Bicyclomycin resistance protein [Leucobacter soli]|uniref:Bicyclomycin resistance protein n=2 Tax=Leucobacter soli TaxID=2812850 RepID=A0A916NHH5_9MICO|nr:Bicyclomycin resistance protein [Leucobacter soli]